MQGERPELRQPEVNRIFLSITRHLDEVVTMIPLVELDAVHREEKVKLLEEAILRKLHEAGGEMTLDNLLGEVSADIPCEKNDVSIGLAYLAGDSVDLDTGPNVRLIHPPTSSTL